MRAPPRKPKNRPFAGHSPQAGFSTMLFTTLLAAGGYAAVEVMRTGVSDSRRSQNAIVVRYDLQKAAEEAQARLALHLGTDISATEQGFVPGKGLPDDKRSRMTSGRYFSSGGDWRLDTSKKRFEVLTCLRREGDASSAMGNHDNNSFTSTSDCAQADMGLSVIHLTEIIKIDHPAYDDPAKKMLAAVIDVRSTAPSGQSFSTAGRVNFLDASQQCDNVDDTNRHLCSTDHCRFMMPVKTAAGDTVYEDATKNAEVLALRPNPNFFEPVYLKVPEHIPTVQAIQSPEEARKKPKRLKDFVKKATAKGLTNPFDADQGVGGFFDPIYYIDMEKRNHLGHVLFRIPSMPPTNGRIAMGGLVRDNRARLEFEGYLYSGEGFSKEAVPWKYASTPAEAKRYRDALKTGCGRTVGSGDADFCARLKLTYATFTYGYAQKRRCTYEGPPTVDQAQLREWGAELGQNIGFVRRWKATGTRRHAGSWQPSARSEAGSFVVGNGSSLANYIDPPGYHHHTIDPKKSLSDRSQKIGFNFKDIWEGSIKVDEVKAETDPDTGSTSYQERRVTYTWKANCVITPEPWRHDPSYKSNLDFNKCYYLAYWNTADRKNCSMGVPEVGHAYECRNSNGCFAGDTPVLMADGSYREIQKLRTGEWVWNPVTQRARQIASLIVGPQKRPMFRLALASGRSVRTTWNHPFATRSGLKRTEDLRIGEEIAVYEGGYQKVVGKEVLPVEEITVWNLALAPSRGQGKTFDPQDHFFVARGIVSGDHTIQEQEDLSTIDWNLQDFHHYLTVRESDAGK